MSKRTQKDSGEERVTAKSKPMMNLVSRCSVRDPNVLASTAPESPGKTKSGSQKVPLNSLNEQQPRTGRRVMGASSSNYSECNIDDKWSSQEWKFGEMLGATTVRPVDDKFVIDAVMDSDTVTEPNLSLKSRSILNRVNDRLRKILDQSSKDAMQDSDKHSLIWRMFMSSNIGSICIHGKALLRKFTIHQKYRERSHFKAYVRHIWIVDNRTLRWYFWSVSNQLGRLSMETIVFGQWWRSHQSVACKGLCIFRFCVMSWKGESEPSIKYCLGSAVELVLEFITIQNFGHNWRRTDGIRVEYFLWIH